MSDLRIRPATSNDFAAIKRLLSAADLPVADLDDRKLRSFHLAERNGDGVGAIGLERHDQIGLLRSLVVSPSTRGQGIGRKLVDVLEGYAADIGLTELWLLTIDADDFFRRLSYEIVARNSAPDRIRQTEEFSDLCPASAYLMKKTITW